MISLDNRHLVLETFRLGADSGTHWNSRLCILLLKKCLLQICIHLSMIEGKNRQISLPNWINLWSDTIYEQVNYFWIKWGNIAKVLQKILYFSHTFPMIYGRMLYLWNWRRPAYFDKIYTGKNLQKKNEIYVKRF